MVAFEGRFCLVGKLGFGGMPAEEVLGDGHDIGTAFAQGRHPDLALIEAVKQVSPETLVLDLGLQILVGGGHDSRVHHDFLLPANPVVRYAVQNTQQLDLHARLQFADLVEKQGARVRQLEQSGFQRVGTAEGALLMSE